jgi:ankyrin repeat protein
VFCTNRLSVDHDRRQTAYRWSVALILVAALVLCTACTDRANEKLWQASMRGDTGIVRSLVTSGDADPNYVRGGWSILMRVARDGRPDIADLLLQLGAEPNFRGKDGASALTIAAERGNLASAKILLNRGADVNIRNDHGNTPLMYAAEFGHRPMVEILLKAGADVEAKDNDGESALMIARRRGNAQIVQVLVTRATTE